MLSGLLFEDNKANMDTYFDFHFHPSLKSFLSEDDAALRESCWTTYTEGAIILRSQSSLEQSWQGGVRLGVAAMYVLERAFTSSFLIEHIAPAITPLDRDMLRLPQDTDNLKRLKSEVAHLKAALNAPSGNGRAMQVIRGMSEYDPNKINLILAIEGSHCLDLFNTRLEDNLRQLKEGEERFLYLNLTHLSRFPTCSHAYGIKLVRGHEQFRPGGAGITELGYRIIDMAYDKTIGGYPLYIDIKHMSLESRRQFYAYRKARGYEAIPIIASHMGCTGISWAPEVIKGYVEKRFIESDTVEVKYIKPRGIGGLFRPKTEFNPWSINLYNEEIPIILDSGGLIGINLDKRILGAKKVDGEFFSPQSYSEIFDEPLPRSLGLRGTSSPQLYEAPGYESDPYERDRALHHLRHLCNHILHIVEIGGARAWKQICIGSDFDGLIDPINGCLSHAELPQLEAEMPLILQGMIKEAKQKKPGLDYKEGSLKARVRDILFNNGVRFLQKYFK
jgi:microsomal dipeptidase-like Zn-dependent dipeptidase